MGARAFRSGEREREGGAGARGGTREEARPHGNAPVRADHGRVRGGVACAVVIERRCCCYYVDPAVRGHKVEGVGHVECAGDMGVRGDDSDACHGEVLQNTDGEISKLA